MKSIYMFCVMGWRIYITRYKLKRFYPSVKSYSRLGIAKRNNEVRTKRYHETGGCCEGCGQHLAKKQMQIHHILPLNVFPQLVHEEWNMMMLCKRCHYMVHNNPLWSGELMRNVASTHDMDLKTELCRATAERYEYITQARKGGVS